MYLMPSKKHALTIRSVVRITLNQREYCVKKPSISDRSGSNDWFHRIVFKRNGRFESTNQCADQELWRNLTWGNINDIFTVVILIQRNFSPLTYLLNTVFTQYFSLIKHFSTVWFVDGSKAASTSHFNEMVGTRSKSSAFQWNVRVKYLNQNFMILMRFHCCFSRLLAENDRLNVIVASLRAKLKSSLEQKEESLRRLGQEKNEASKKTKEMVNSWSNITLFLSCWSNEFRWILNLVSFSDYRKKRCILLKTNWRMLKICVKQFYLWWANGRNQAPKRHDNAKPCSVSHSH